MSLTQDDLGRAVASAYALLRTVRAKYPRLRAHLVLADRGEQVDLDATTADRLGQFLGMFLPNAARDEAVAAWASHQAHAEAARAASRVLYRARLADKERQAATAEEQARERRAASHAALERFREAEAQLLVRGDVNVEMRFDELDFRLIEELKREPLVDRSRTPQDRVSIRIVLGTVEALARRDPTGDYRG